MRRIQVDPAAPDPVVIRQAARVLREGGLVAFPTETVYGLGAVATNESAVRRIYAAKGRPRFNPLIVHVPDSATAAALAVYWPGSATRLADTFWPGPLTLVVEKVREIPDVVTAGLPTVGVRVPRHPVALALLREVGLPVAAPSANPFMSISSTTGEHVERALGERIDVLLDAGASTVGIESTVVDVSADPPVLLRPGAISREMLAGIVGELRDAEDAAEGTAQPAPGMLRRHYAPRATLRVFDGGDREHIAAEIAAARTRGQRVGALLLRADLAVDHAIEMPEQASQYARRLYAALHELDDAGCALILVEQVPDLPEWLAVRDRLTRAAAPA